MTQPTTEVAVYQHPTAGALINAIDIAAEKASLDKFRDFIHSVLDKDKGHFGKMPGVKRDFLQQPGAEIIYRALQARPEYTIESEQIDWDEKLCYYRTKCRVVHIESGITLGEAEGTASSLEYAANCTVRGTGAGMVHCELHGDTTPRMDWGDVRGQKVPFCSGKNPQGLDRTLQNVLAKANKRAMVAAIRTLGCVSEMFSQDEDLVTDAGMPPDPRENGRQAPASRSGTAPARPTTSTSKPKPGPAPQAGGHLAETAKAVGGTPVKQEAAAPSRTLVGGFDIEEIREAMATLKDILQEHEIRAFFEDAGVLAAGAPITAKPLAEYCKKHGVGLPEMVEAAHSRFKDDPAPAEAPADVVDGEYTEDVDDAPL